MSMQPIRGGVAMAAVAVLAGWVAPSGLRADVSELRYTILDLGTLGGTYSSAEAINSLGQVVGHSTTGGGSEYHAFLYAQGIMHDLGTLGGKYSWAYDINDAGQVVGVANTSDGEPHAFLWANGEMQDLGTLGGDYSQAYAINEHGQVVGKSTNAAGETHAFLWSDGLMGDLGELKLPPDNMSINDEGVVVYTTNGTRGISSPTDISNSGVIVGWTSVWSKNLDMPVAVPAMYRDGDTVFLELLSDYNQAQARAVNESCQVVGTIELVRNLHTGAPTILSSAPFLWEKGVMADLNDLLESTSARIDLAEDINDLGQIVGSGPDSHALLLTPVPEPASLAVLAGAAAGLLRRRRTWKPAGRQGP